MTTQQAAISDIASLVQCLREQVTENFGPRSNRTRHKGDSSSSDPNIALEHNVLSLLDLLDNNLSNDNISVTCDNIPNKTYGPLLTHPRGPEAEQFLEVLERSLSQWQSQISLAYAQGASRELSEQLQLADQLSDALQAREQRLETLREQLEQNLANLLQREARTARQRSTLAHSMRARRAESLLELELKRRELLQELDSVQAEEHAEISELRGELSALRGELRSTLDELQSSRTELNTLRSELEKSRGAQSDLRDQLAAAQAQAQAQAQLDSADNLASARSEEQEELIDALQQQLCDAQTELEQLRLQPPADPDTPLRMQAQSDAIVDLKTLVARLEQQLDELRSQNSDLAAQLAKQQVQSSGPTPHVTFQSESLSWEERKRLMMQQLEDESAGTQGADDQVVERHLEIEQILETTQSEIERRDREIAELHSIIEQQSDTRQGVAIGAAAFAQAFDNDEIIRQEREKLKEIQRQWEEKLRQAEIDVSLERAKLARERSQLETELENTKREKAAGEREPEKIKKHKWLEHLGLKEENLGDK
jgi:hypothetical protein